ncbi:unnamed protein product [Prorocentrum cordatum]|uniref:Inward rectifier potassium channel C-terminal domain-containing protein n=1 Tax=Prorocentrum cordatum TaxID=2364126 RepID=A0ABN9YDE6_9DINO|nr:unnamed protein product [Polarella glacialis]
MHPSDKRLLRKQTSFGSTITRFQGDWLRKIISPGGSSGAKLLNKPHRATAEQLLRWLYQASWPALILATLLVFIATAVLLAVTLYPSCRASPSDGFVRVLSIVFSALGGGGHGTLDEATHCIMIVGLLNFVALLLQGTLFSVIVTKVMNPSVKLRFSSRLVVITRGGEQYLSFRLVHPNGDCITNLEVETWWAHREKTPEGESFVQLDEVVFPVNGSMLFLPRTFTHKIDKASPFWPYREALCEAHGQLNVHVKGTDQYLNTDFCDAWVYNVPDVDHVEGTQYHWADMFIALPDGTTGADLAKIDEVAMGPDHEVQASAAERSIEVPRLRQRTPA